ncbi:MAG: cyclase family protein [Anaerolineales bacterium]
MKIYDISIPISNQMIVWPGDPPVDIRTICSIAKRDDANVSLVQMNVHTGTHIDAPKHFLANGATTDQIPITKLTGTTLVLEIDPDEVLITSSVLKKHPDWGLLKQTKKVLFKTRNSTFWSRHPNLFIRNYIGIEKSGAEILADLELDLIGIDYLSIAPFGDTSQPHKILLSKEIVILEGIDLSDVPPGFYELICLPLSLSSVEGAPARAILKS